MDSPELRYAPFWRETDNYFCVGKRMVKATEAMEEDGSVCMRWGKGGGGGKGTAPHLSKRGVFLEGGVALSD